MKDITFVSITELEGDLERVTFVIEWFNWSCGLGTFECKAFDQYEASALFRKDHKAEYQVMSIYEKGK